MKLHAIEVGSDAFVFPEEATVGHWRAALKYWQSEGFIPQPREIKQMIKIADALGLSDDVVLLPRRKPRVAACKCRSPSKECGRKSRLVPATQYKINKTQFGISEITIRPATA